MVSDAKWNDIMTTIEEIPEHTPERCEAMAFLFMTLARAQWRKADYYRREERKREVREQRARARAGSKVHTVKGGDDGAASA